MNFETEKKLVLSIIIGLVAAIFILVNFGIVLFPGWYDNQGGIGEDNTPRMVEKESLVIGPFVVDFDTSIFHGTTHFEGVVIFESPVIFDSTAIFRDGVTFGGETSFARQPVIAYD